MTAADAQSPRYVARMHRPRLPHLRPYMFILDYRSQYCISPCQGSHKDAIGRRSGFPFSRHQQASAQPPPASQCSHQYRSRTWLGGEHVAAAGARYKVLGAASVHFSIGAGHRQRECICADGSARRYRSDVLQDGRKRHRGPVRLQRHRQGSAGSAVPAG